MSPQRPFWIAGYFVLIGGGLEAATRFSPPPNWPMWIFAELSIHVFFFLGALFSAYGIRDVLAKKERVSNVNRWIRALETKFVLISLMWLGSALTVAVLSFVLRFF